MDALQRKFQGWVDEADAGDCWTWRRSHYRSGYPVFNRGYAHRYAYEYGHGELIPDGYQVDHICMNRGCVNPSHLRLATNKENNEHQGYRRNNTTGYRGVCLHRPSGRFIAYVTHEGKRSYLGYYDTPFAAGEAARLKRVELFTHNALDRAA